MRMLTSAATTDFETLERHLRNLGLILLSLKAMDKSELTWKWRSESLFLPEASK